MGSSDRTVGSRLPAVLVLVVLAVVTLSGFAISRRALQKEEMQLLHERGSELAAILSTATVFRTSLEVVGEVYASDEGAGPAFTAAARSLVTGTTTAVGVAELVDGDVVVGAGEGTGLAPGDVLAGERADLVRRAVEAEDLASAIVRGDDVSTLVIALGRPDGIAVLQESLLANEPVTAEGDGPFQGLDAALYRASSPEPSAVVITTADLPLPGAVDQRELAFGSETWLLQTSSESALASPQARALPWLILGGGLVAAVLTSGVVLLLTRRRAYALALVDQRTSDLREAMAELEEARVAADTGNKAKSQFLSRMSHELRTPLNSVLGFAQLLEINDLTPEDRDAVDHILKGGRHLLDLINEVLDISRIESGDIALSPESVLASEVVTEILELMQPLAASRSVHIAAERQLSCQHYVFADRQRLKQILLNLLSNAVKYNRVGGSVTVTCEEVGTTRLRIKVTDTGPGISDEDRSMLFVPFERLGADRTDVEGTGIGLALSLRLAEAMGGALDLESTDRDGSTFSVELPLVEGAVERYERLTNGGSAPIDPAPGGERRKVLYIEDNLANVTLVQRILGARSDIELVPAMQGRLGLDLARQHVPGLILMDLHLPDLPGDELLQQLRDDPETRSIPVVIVSADATTGQVQRLKAAGASAYLTKPFDVRELLDVVTEALRGTDSAR